MICVNRMVILLLNFQSSQKSFNEDKSSNDENEDDDLKEFDFDNYDNEDGWYNVII